MRLQTIMNAEHIYSIADNHAQTVQVCIPGPRTDDWTGND
jgi:hypothetical protein